MNVGAHRGDAMTGTDAEACAYLYTASLTQPIDHDWTEIYLYITNQVYSRHRTKESGALFPEDIQVKTLSDHQMGELRQLKAWIYERRTQAKQGRDKAESRERREEEATRRKAEQPSLFQS